MTPKITAVLALVALALAACSGLGDIRDRDLDPGAPYRPTPDPAAAR